MGKRSNGKSYSAKNKAIKRAWEDCNAHRFVYVRRYESDIKSDLVEQYFKDTPIEVISNGQATGISLYRGQIWAVKTDPETLKEVKVKHIGYVRALNLATRYKSGAYPDVDFILFEEFISDEGYLPKEVSKFKNLVSTIARLRKIKVVLIGNTISRVCPYYNEWKLFRVPKQKQGTIDFYQYTYFDYDLEVERTVKIAVEFCANQGKTGQMFFGQEDEMIMTGAWETPRIPEVSPHVGTTCYTIVVMAMGFMFLAEFKMCDTGLCFWYITPKTTRIKPKTRVVTDKEVFNAYYTKGFRALNKKETTLFSYFTEDRIFFSYPLCAADFRSVIKQIRRSF